LHAHARPSQTAQPDPHPTPVGARWSTQLERARPLRAWHVCGKVQQGLARRKRGGPRIRQASQEIQAVRPLQQERQLAHGDEDGNGGGRRLEVLPHAEGHGHHRRASARARTGGEGPREIIYESSPIQSQRRRARRCCPPPPLEAVAAAAAAARGGCGFNCQYSPKSQHPPGRPHCPAAGAILVTRPATQELRPKGAQKDRSRRTAWGCGFNCQYSPKSHHPPGRPHCPATGAILVTRPATQELHGLGGPLRALATIGWAGGRFQLPVQAQIAAPPRKAPLPGHRRHSCDPASDTRTARPGGGH
jgi:hypothetical protein